MKTIHVLVVLSLCLLLSLTAAPVWGQKKVKELTYPALGKFDIPKPERVVLDNGITVYLLEDHTLPKVNLSARINRCGAYLESPGKIGLAVMTGQVMRTGGTASKAGDQLDEELESIGASVETWIGTTAGGASAYALTEYTDKIIGVLADVLRNPVFNEDKIELARTSAKSDISRRNDEPMTIGIREFRKMLLGADSPYARHTEYATIDAITRDDMVAFHKQYVQPNSMQIAVWGDFKRGDMLALIKKYFGTWPKAAAQPPEPPEVKYTFRPTVNYAEKTDVNQSNILIGHIGGQMGDPDYPATIVMNSVLGGSFGSRITDNVRSKMGLAYTAEGQYTFDFGRPGMFYAYAATKSESTVKAIREMITQIRSMQTTPPTDEEMKRAKDGWLNSYVFNFESKGEIINRMVTYDYYGLPLEYLQQLKDAVEKVTPQDVIQVAQRKLNPDNLQILVVGKADGFDEPLSAFGAVKTIDLTIPAPAQEAFAADSKELAEGKKLWAQAAAACGGPAKFKGVQTVSSDAKINLITPQGAMPLDISSIDVFPDKSVQIIKTPMGDQTLVIDGAIGWVTAGGQSQALPASQIEDQKKEMERSIIRLFARADQPDYQVAAKGTEEFEGKTVTRLDFVSAGGAQFTIYLDPAGNQPVGMRYMGTTMAGPGEVVETMGEYKDFGGIMMPTRKTQKGGGMTVEAEVIKLEINGAIDQSIFTKPDGI